MFLHADSEDSDQTGRTTRLIKIFAGFKGYYIGFVMRRLKGNIKKRHQIQHVWRTMRTGLVQQGGHMLSQTNEQQNTTLEWSVKDCRV